MNAKESMPEGGVIELDAGNTVVAASDVPSLAAGRYVKLSIKDHGVGISEENRSRVFDPYFSTKRRGSQKGMGLGLTIAYAIVKRHDGLISIHSTPGIGTEVQVFLPVSGEKPVETRRPSEVKAPPSQGKSALYGRR